jgi:undecaprenyl-diphosphatase
MKTKHFSSTSLWLILAFIMAFLLFYRIADEAVHEHEDAFDQRVIQLRHSFVTAGLIRLMKVITFFGDRKFQLPAYCLIVGILMIRRSYNYAIVIACASLGSAVIERGFKATFHRIRPEFQEITKLTGYSFPSGHAISAFVFGTILIFLTWHTKWNRALKWTLTFFLALMILAIGFSRIVLNVHYATDVLGGFLLGSMWLILVYAVMTRFTRE